MVQVIPLASALTDAGKHGEPSVRLGNVVDQLHDQHGLSDTGSSEQPNLSSLLVRGQQIHNLDSGHKHLLLRRLVHVGRRLAMDRPHRLALNRTLLIDRLSDHVHDASQRLATDRNGDRRAGVHDGLSTGKSIRGLHSNATHSLVPDVLRDLENQTHVVVLHLEGGHDGRQVAVKVHVDDGTDDLRDLATAGVHSRLRSESTRQRGDAHTRRQTGGLIHGQRCDARRRSRRLLASHASKPRQAAQ
mmetsp:Transcript_5226/g.14981  ORF Transcript_5226/g.14981 Transcript_5226/m.14981 type:complete len:245 (-) Transcript_5226:59-793(-)